MFTVKLCELCPELHQWNMTYHYSMIDYCAACKVLGYKCMLTMPFATAKDLFYKCMESW